MTKKISQLILRLWPGIRYERDEEEEAGAPLPGQRHGRRHLHQRHVPRRRLPPPLQCQERLV